MTNARVSVWLWIAQRISAAVLSVCVVVHLVTITLAVRGGLSAAEIVARLNGRPGWLLFYLVFVLAAAIHAPLGLRTILYENTRLQWSLINSLSGLLAAVLVWFGGRAVFGLFGA